MSRGKILNGEGPGTIDTLVHHESKGQFGENAGMLESNPIRL
jgi:hypothetical protein